MRTIFDSLRPGVTILHSDEEFGTIWTWVGGCTVNVVDVESGRDVDVFSWCEKPESTAQAVQWARERVRRLIEEQEEDDFDEDDEDDYYEYDGQPDEAQEWHDFDPDC